MSATLGTYEPFPSLERGYSAGTGWYEPRHGSRSRYRKGCRCYVCREAERLYRADYRARLRAARQQGVTP